MNNNKNLKKKKQTNKKVSEIESDGCTTYEWILHDWSIHLKMVTVAKHIHINSH